jgi:hypothetical protein
MGGWMAKSILYIGHPKSLQKGPTFLTSKFYRMAKIVKFQALTKGPIKEPSKIAIRPRLPHIIHHKISQSSIKSCDSISPKKFP